MRKILTSFGNNSHAEYLSIASPSFVKFADKFGYDCYFPNINTIKNDIINYLLWDKCERPSSWWKVPLIQYLFEKMEYDVVFWVDADTMFINPQEDPINYLGDGIQANVTHQVLEGNILNCGVWMLSREASLGYLKKVWNNKQFIQHCWWEQASVHHTIKENKDIAEQTKEIPYSWNIHKNDLRGIPDKKDISLMHFTMFKSRSDTMRGWAANAK